MVDEVGSDELREERRENICEEDDRFGNIRTNEVKCCGEDDHVGEVIDKAYEG